MVTARLEPRVHVNCNLCGENNYKVLFRKQDRTFSKVVEREDWYLEQGLTHENLVFTCVQCRRCDLVYVNPRLREDILNRFYTDRFSGRFSDVFPDYSKMGEQKSRHANSVLDRLGGIREFKTVMDIGAANGYLLSVAKERGKKVYGVEVVESCVRSAQEEFGIELFNGTFEEYYKSGDSQEFDVVVLNDIIEHLSDPFDTLRKIRDIITEKGLLYILTPNINAGFNVRITRDQWGMAVERHLTLFSPDTLRRMLEKARFTVVQQTTSAVSYQTGSRNSAATRFAIRKVRSLLSEKAQTDAGQEKGDAEDRKPGRSPLGLREVGRYVLGVCGSALVPFEERMGRAVNLIAIGMADG